jgi:hypothetical protein
MKFARAFIVVAVPLLVAAGIAAASGAFDGAKPATARFHDLDKAKDAGYTVRVADLSGATCIAQPGQGAMGVHMLNPTLLFDSKVDAETPELLVYEPRSDGALHLVALEYLVFQSGPGGWNSSEPPSLFGRQFDFIASPNRYGLPPFYALHAWIWKHNHSGTFAMWNPNVTCP